MKNGLITVGNTVASLVSRHPKRVSAVVAALLLGGGGGAFAVASLGPDPSDLPLRQVLEAVQPLPVQAQTEALDTHSFKLFRSDITRATDTADTLLKRLGVADAAAAAFLRNDARARASLFGRAGRTVSAEASDDNEIGRAHV